MPLVSIALLKGKSPEYIRALSAGVHQALIDAFDIPPGDQFQLIRQCEPGELIYDPDYLGIHRTDDVVFIHITAGKWRNTKVKRRLYKRLVELLAQSPGLRPEDVQVIISPNDPDDWSFGNGLAPYVDEPKE